MGLARLAAPGGGLFGRWLITSMRCVATVKSGFSAVIGSWKIIAMRLPR